MSKSYDNTVNLSDSEETIRVKIASMITDPKKIKLSDPGHPQVCNVFSYYAVFLPQEKDKLTQACQEAKLGCVECKKKLASCLIDKLAPLQKKRQDLLQDQRAIRKILEAGKEKASAVAQRTVEEAKSAMRLNI